MKNAFKFFIALFLVALIFPSCEKTDDTPETPPTTANFSTIATDPSGDGALSTNLDGTLLEYQYDATADSIWFLFTLNDITATQDIGFNVMVNIPNGGSTFNFWGDDNKNAYHKLLTVWVTGTAPSNYTGTIGIANSTGVAANNYTNLSQNNLSFTVNTTAKTALIGVKRTDLITNTEFSGNTITVDVAGAVGSNTFWNDDLYSATASMTLTK